MNNDSIYFFIQKALKSIPGTPYSFQNSLISGYPEVSFLSSNMYNLDLSRFTNLSTAIDETNYIQKSLNSKNLVDLVKLATESNASDKDIRNLLDFLYKNKLYVYMDIFMEKLETTISNNYIDRDLLYKLGLFLATESFENELTSLGILILAFYENDLSIKILKTLGYHSLFTPYTIESFKRFKNSNDLIFDLAKNTISFGKIISLLNFHPITKVHFDWLIEKGGVDINYPEICSAIVLSKPELNEKMIDYLSDKEYLYSLSYIFSYGISDYYFSNYDWTDYSFEKYCALARNESDFLVLSSFIAITEYLQSNIDILPNENMIDGWNFGKKFIVSGTCEEFISKTDRSKVVLNSLTEAQHSPNLIIKALKKLQLTPKFEYFSSLIDKHNFNPVIGSFLIERNGDIYLKDVLKYTKDELSNVFANFGPIKERKMIFSSDKYENNWIILLLNSMKENNLNDESFFLECLKSKNPKIRTSAVRCLENFSRGWSDDVFNTLKELFEYEPSGLIKREMQNLISIGQNSNKLNKLIDISSLSIELSDNDEYVFEVNIVGTFYHDLAKLFDKVKKGTLLYLVKITQKDSTINIAVTTTDGYVLGYIPNENLDIILPLIEFGNSIYGIFNSRDLDIVRPSMSIMMNSEIYKSKKVTPIDFYKLNN